MNALIDHVRASLQDENIRQDFINTLSDRQPEERQQLQTWVENIAQRSIYMDETFVTFAGQGRVRWHYGAAHPILSDIENSYLAEQGRWWLRDEEEARLRLVLGQVDKGLVWFDFRELWQISSAVLIVTATIYGAFALSYFTPTVGLGCRSGGYVVFFVITAILMLMEMIIWWVVSPVEVQQPQWLRRSTTALLNRVEEANKHGVLFRLKRRVSRLKAATEMSFISITVKVVGCFPWKNKDEVIHGVENKLHEWLSRLSKTTTQRRWELFFFRPVEVANTCWLVRPPAQHRL